MKPPYFGRVHPTAGDQGDQLSVASTVYGAASYTVCSWSCGSEHAVSVFPKMAALELAGNPSYLG